MLKQYDIQEFRSHALTMTAHLEIRPIADRLTYEDFFQFVATDAGIVNCSPFYIHPGK